MRLLMARDPAALRTWYKRHLGIDVQDWGGAVFTWTDGAGNLAKRTTTWSIFAAGSDYFAPDTSTFMRPAGRAEQVADAGCPGRRQAAHQPVGGPTGHRSRR